jgi:hypothetical protein
VKTVALVVVLVASAVGCHAHGPALPAIPGKGGPAWIEIQSEHFTLWTDGPRDRAQRLIRQMEHLRQVVLGTGFTSANAEGRSLVLALRDAEEVGVFVPPQFAAFASSGGAARQGVIILPSDAQDDNAPLITHELTHVISYNVIHHQPSWFAEGMANFFATVNLDPDTAAGDIGQPLDYIVRELKTTAPTHAAAMFACTEHACMDDMFYATAWAMFSFLANAHPQELLSYAQRLDELPPEAQAQAWTEVFPALTPDKLDHELREWLAHGKHTVWKFNVQLRTWPTTERTLNDADVLAARALMRQIGNKKGAPPSEITEALAADPTNLLARLVADAYHQPLTLDEARRVAETHREDWRAWMLVAQAANWNGDDARTARDTACALLKQHPSAWAPTKWCTGP